MSFGSRVLLSLGLLPQLAAHDFPLPPPSLLPPLPLIKQAQRGVPSGKTQLIRHLLSFPCRVSEPVPPAWPGRRFDNMPHYHLMQQVHMDHIPEAEHDWGPAPGEHAYTPGMLAKLRTLNPMFWRCAILSKGNRSGEDCGGEN